MYDYDVECELVLRTCDADGKAYGHFQWPLEVGEIAVAPDWTPTKECGGGLHGLLHGRGDGNLLSWGEGVKWMVVEMPKDLIADLEGKVKAPWARVVHIGDQQSATEFLKERGHTSGVVGQTVEGEHYDTVTSGHSGAATTGDQGVAITGDRGVAVAGYGGTAIAGFGGTSKAGYGGSAISGDYGITLVGDNGTATAGERGAAAAGEQGMIQIRYSDKGGRTRLKVGYTGEGKLKPDTIYGLNKEFNFVEVSGDSQLDLKRSLRDV